MVNYRNKNKIKIRKCLECGKDMKKARLSFKLENEKGFKAEIDNIEGYKCPTCGEAVIDYDTSLMLQDYSQQLPDIENALFGR